jgi:rod shape determining protein RodA
MAAEIDKPSLLQRIVPLFRGFDFLLLLFIAMLAGAGLLAMYSAGLTTARALWTMAAIC